MSDNTLPTGARELLETAGSTTTGLEALAGAGSARRFWRSRAGVLSLTPDPEEICRLLEIGAALGRSRVPLPTLVAADPARGLALHEDVGPDSFTLLARKHEGPAGRRPPPEPLPTGPLSIRARGAYAYAIELIGRLQTTRLPACALSPFSRDDLRWESWYGLTHCFWGQLRIARPEHIEGELEQICALVLSGPQAPMHRDYQSTNIHVDGRGAVRILDWTGMRRGPLLYDLVSLLWDPYVEIDAVDREALLEAWPGGAVDRELLHATATQRLLQALGAYAFLPRHCGRLHFAAFVAPALRLLRPLVQPWPRLHALVAEAQS